MGQVTQVWAHQGDIAFSLATSVPMAPIAIPRSGQRQRVDSSCGGEHVVTLLAIGTGLRRTAPSPASSRGRSSSMMRLDIS